MTSTTVSRTNPRRYSGHRARIVSEALQPTPGYFRLEAYDSLEPVLYLLFLDLGAELFRHAPLLIGIAEYPDMV